MANTTQQDFAHHTRWDPSFHFFVIPVLIITAIGYIVTAVTHPGIHSTWMAIFALALAWAGFKIRLYPLQVQDRVIRLEERLRLMTILKEPLRARIGELTEGQLVALRFASDGELNGLVQDALDNKLSRTDIKKKIQQWRPDEFRV